MSSQACDPSLISQVKVYRSLICQGKLPLRKFDCAASLRVLSLDGCGLEEIPADVENLIHLRYLDLARNTWLGHIPLVVCKLYYLETLYLAGCGLKEIPEDIGNLIHLTHLDLSNNSGIKKLPKTICNLHELRTLVIRFVYALKEFPEGIERLTNLKHILNYGTMLRSFPEGLKKLTNLQTLEEFCESGDGGSKLEYLNKLDRLSGNLKLDINVNGVESVVHARKAELRKKTGITWLTLRFLSQSLDDFTGESRDDKSINNDILEGLELPPNLRYLKICDFLGSKLPGWIASSLNHLIVLETEWCFGLLTLPPLGKLPCLEKLSISGSLKLEHLGREFLGITEKTTMQSTPPSSSSVDCHAFIGFPKLKWLVFSNCNNWTEWEDITAEEEGNTDFSIMPCLKMLQIEGCESIKELPHRLLRRASSLRSLEIHDCFHLQRVYRDEDAWRSLSHIPELKIT